MLDSYCESNAHAGVYSENQIIDSLIKSGQLNSALKVFDEKPLCDVVTYNLLISGHANTWMIGTGMRLHGSAS